MLYSDAVSCNLQEKEWDIFGMFISFVLMRLLDNTIVFLLQITAELDNLSLPTVKRQRTESKTFSMQVCPCLLYYNRDFFV